MFQLESWQWWFLAVGAVAFLWTRKDTLLAKFKSIFGGGSTTAATSNDANAVAAAYRVIAPAFPPEFAAEARKYLSEMLLTQPPPVATDSAAATDKGPSILESIAPLFTELQAFLVSQKAKEAKP